MAQTDPEKQVPELQTIPAAQLDQAKASSSTATLATGTAESLPLEELKLSSELASSSAPVQTLPIGTSAHRQLTQVLSSQHVAPKQHQLPVLYKMDSSIVGRSAKPDGGDAGISAPVAQAAALPTTYHVSQTEAARASNTAVRQTASLPPKVNRDPRQLTPFSPFELFGRQLCGPKELELSRQLASVADVQDALARMTAPATAGAASSAEVCYCPAAFLKHAVPAARLPLFPRLSPLHRACMQEGMHSWASGLHYHYLCILHVMHKISHECA